MALNWKLRGFDYTSYYKGGFTNADSLPALVQTGSNAVGTTLEWGIDPQNNTVYADSNYTDPLSAEASAIDQAVADGLQVMVKPAIDFLKPSYLTGTPYSVGDWRTYYNPGAAGSAGANAFFASYKTMILSEAQVAAANGATMLCLGTELDQICGPSYKSYWDDIISAIRQQDPTLKLTFAADWNDAASPWLSGGSGLPVGTGDITTQISFASELDYLGLDVYAPLSDAANPTLAQLVAGWTQAPVDSGATAATYQVTGGKSLIAYFESVATELGKPLLFTEVGFENASDAASSPAVSQTNVENDALQAFAYQSLFQAYSQSGDTAVQGAYLYNWDPNASEVGPGSVAFSPQNLPALAQVDAAFAAPTLSVPGTVEAGAGAAAGVPGLAIGTGSTGSVFTVVVTVSYGNLSASGAATISGAGTAKLTVAGSLASVNATLATLSYTETQAKTDVLQATVSADGGTSATVTSAIEYDPAYPTLNFGYVTYVSGSTVNVSGTANSANAGRNVVYSDNGAPLTSTTVAAGGAFNANLTFPSAGLQVVTAQIQDVNGGVGATPPLMISLTDGVTANFSAADGDVADLFFATVAGDMVNGSNGTIVLTQAEATVDGGGDAIYFDGSPEDLANLTGSAGSWSTVSGSGGSVQLSGAYADVFGDDAITLEGNSGNLLALSGTDGTWETVTGDDATIYMRGAYAAIAGDDTIYLQATSGNLLALYGDDSRWSHIVGDDATIFLRDAYASIEGDDTVYLQAKPAFRNTLELSGDDGQWSTIVGDKAAIYMNGAYASGVGDNNFFMQATSGNLLALYGDESGWNTVFGDDATIFLRSGYADVMGYDTVYLQATSGAILEFDPTYATLGHWSNVYGSGATIYVSPEIFVSVVGNDNIFLPTVDVSRVTAAALTTTGGTDAVLGDFSYLLLRSAQLELSGSSDDVEFDNNFGGDAVTQTGGGQNVFIFEKGIGGEDTISGFTSDDTLQLSVHDFRNYQALQNSGDLQVAGQTTVLIGGSPQTTGGSTFIRIDGADSVLVQNVVLTAAQFSFG